MKYAQKIIEITMATITKVIWLGYLIELSNIFYIGRETILIAYLY